MGVGTFGLYQITCYLLWLLDKTILNLKISAVALVTNVLINMILIPKMGILGASVATFLSNIVLAFWTTAAGKKYFPYVFPWRATAKIVLATLMMSIFLLIILYYIEVNNLYKLLSAIIIAFSIYGSIDLLGKNSFLLQLVKTL
jgi:O-antigen/teichoic acid export membrane protein